jgi:monoamine oxidase
VKERVWRKQGYTGYAFSDNPMTSGWDHTQLQQNNQGAGGYTIFLAGKAGEDSGKTPMEELQNKYIPALEAISPALKISLTITSSSGTGPGMPLQRRVMFPIKKGRYTTMSGAQFKR